MRPVITGINENGEGGAVEWVNVGVKPTKGAAEPIRTMAQRVEERMLIVIAGRQSNGSSSELRAAYARQFEAMRNQLGASYADPLERLLIERIILTWARLQYVEEQVTYSYMPDVSNAATAMHWDERLTNAQNRFLKACAALARVRQLQQRRRPPGGATLGELTGGFALGKDANR